MCKAKPGFTYIELSIPSKRRCNLHNLRYFNPHHYDRYNGNHKQLDEFVNIIDVLQLLMDAHGSKAPIKICGAFNTQLPSTKCVDKHWYRKSGFTWFSAMLYGFLEGN